jgi:hypothetical protein
MAGTDGREQLLESLQVQTGWPVLAGIVAASDGAQVIGYSPRAGRWSGWLMLETLVGYLGSPYTDCLAVEEDEELPEDDEFWQDRYREACRLLYELAPPASIAAPGAVAWAKEAGCAPIGHGASQIQSLRSAGVGKSPYLRAPTAPSGSILRGVPNLLSRISAQELYA